MIDLRLVEFAVALDKYRNFARAAQSMRVTQPTFSRGIAALEATLGARLFERSTRRVEPTPTGLAFLERAERILQDAVRLGQLSNDHDSGLNGQLTVGSGPYALEVGVLPALARLTAQHPRLRIRVIEGAWRELPPLLLLGSVDVIVVEASIFGEDHRVQVEPLPQHRGCLVCRKGHPLTRLRRVSIDDLDPYPLAGITMRRTFALQVGQTLRKLDVDPRSGDLTPGIATSSLRAMREIVLRSDAIGIDLLSLVRAGGDPGSLVILPTDFEIPSTGYGIVKLRGRTLSTAAVAFMQILRDVEREQVDGRPPAHAPNRTRSNNRGSRGKLSPRRS
jgi:DNA-binding transcriptional LysR family regulator